MTDLAQPEGIDERFAPRLRDHVTLVPVEQEALLYEEGAAAIHQLNSSAAAVCALFDGEVPLHVLIDDAAAVFEAERSEVAVDILELARDLGRKGLLVGVMGENESQAPARGDARS